MDRGRCCREIADLEVLIIGGHPDLDGLCLALSDWWAELRLVEQETVLEAKTPATAEAGRADWREQDATS